MLAFGRMLKERERRGLKSIKFGTTPRDVFNWWMEYDVLPGQMNWFEDYEEDSDEP